MQSNDIQYIEVGRINKLRKWIFLIVKYKKSIIRFHSIAGLLQRK